MFPVARAVLLSMCNRVYCIHVPGHDPITLYYEEQAVVLVKTNIFLFQTKFWHDWPTKALSLWCCQFCPGGEVCLTVEENERERVCVKQLKCVLDTEAEPVPLLELHIAMLCFLIPTHVICCTFWSLVVVLTLGGIPSVQKRQMSFLRRVACTIFETKYFLLL